MAAWQVQCVRGLRDAGVAITTILYEKAAQKSSARAPLLWRIVRSLWRPEGLCRIDVQETFGDLASAREASEAAWEQQVHEGDPDAILHFGELSSLPSLARTARVPVWHFRFGTSNQIYPLAVHETVRAETIVKIELLSRSEQAEVALKTAYLKLIRYSMKLAVDHVLSEAAKLAHYAAGSEPQGSAQAVNDSKAFFPGTIMTLRFVGRFLRNWASQKLRYLFFEERWSVGVIKQSVEECVAGPLSRVHWLAPSKGREFVADPFGMKHGDSTIVLCELFDYAVGRGRICATRYEGDEWQEALTEVLPFETHASFPFLLRHNGEIYCIPETYQANEVSLFHATNFPREWKKVKTLLHGVSAIDSTIFELGGRWWLFCTLFSEGAHYKLYGWHSEDLFGDWTPHAQNPIKIDIRSARNAGAPFWVGSKIYRPSQDCAESYGSAVTINEILELTPNTFRESIARRLSIPRGEGNSLGIHTLSGADGVTLIDGKRREFTARGLRYEMHRPLRLLQRLWLSKQRVCKKSGLG